MSSDGAGSTSANSIDEPRCSCGNDAFIQTKRSSDGDANEQDNVYMCTECGKEHPPSLIEHQQTQSVVPTWKEIFGHPSPYPHQETGITDTIKTGRRNGYMVLEGRCGTGKTMIGLTSAARLIKDPSTQYDKALILTSVKQQQRQFESDLRVINQNLPDEAKPLTAVTLVGKGDLCPYTQTEYTYVSSDNINSRWRELRSNTNDLIGAGTNTRVLTNSAVIDADSPSNWEVNGEITNYKPVIPEKDIEYCPFYSAFQQNNDPLFTFGHAEDCILDPDEIVAQAVNKGVCPHSAMSSLCNDAEIVIANYYHAFDNNTIKITHELLDESTFLICDEAHMLESRVRQIQSTDCSLYDIKQAQKEIVAVHNAFQNTIDGPNTDNLPTITPAVAAGETTSAGLDGDALKDAYFILSSLQNQIETVVKDYLDSEYPGWEQSPSRLPNQIEIPLRDPTEIEKDVITEWSEQENIPGGFWSILPSIGTAIENTLDEDTPVGNSNEWSVNEVVNLLYDWFQDWANNNPEYFREIVLQKRSDSLSYLNGWQSHYFTSIELQNVMPRNIIAQRLKSFGGGILMSATLEPMDVYKHITGLSLLEHFEDTPVVERTFRTSFPSENRYSATLPLPKFTWDNRGEPPLPDNMANPNPRFQNEFNDTRTKYAKAMLIVATTTPGNVLICMPSYQEAKWAGAVLRSHPDLKKPVLIDEPSAKNNTQKLKEDFFKGNGKVLTTSLKGTLTEGVDYSGDRLSGCIICGIPIDQIGSPKTQAVKTAYTDEFESDDDDGSSHRGFRYALTVPAIRKTRQALGRVIRGEEDVGVRVLADKRYAIAGPRGVRSLLPDDEQTEYSLVKDLETFSDHLNDFWQSN